MASSKTTTTKGKTVKLKKRQAPAPYMLAKPQGQEANLFTELKKRSAPAPYMMAKPLSSNRTILDGAGQDVNSANRRNIVRARKNRS